jgi:large subunit ribosomal protein L3
VTTVGLEVVDVRKDDNLILIKGALPGANGSMLVVKQSNRRAR